MVLSYQRGNALQVFDVIEPQVSPIIILVDHKHLQSEAVLLPLETLITQVQALSLYYGDNLISDAKVFTNEW